MAERIETYGEFWTRYLREHARPQTRALHYAGTGAGLALVVAALVLGEPWLIAAALVAGYGPAWVGHYFVENNRPATFTHPMWSVYSDFRMIFCWMTGRLGRELRKAGVE